MGDAQALAGRTDAAGHELLQRVYFEDTDFSGRVYHARYLHFLERGRSDYLRLLGFNHRELAAEGLGFVVRRMEIDFLQPAQIDDVLAIRSAPRAIGGVRLTLVQQVFRGAALLVSAQVMLVMVTADGRPARLPAGIRAAFGPARIGAVTDLAR